MNSYRVEYAYIMKLLKSITSTLPTLRRGQCILQEIVDDEQLSHEFIIKQPKLNGFVFIFCMIVLNWIGYQVEIYAQDHSLLSAVVVFLLVLLFINVNNKVKQESLLVMGSVGVQYTIQFVSGRRKAEFLADSQVKDIVINEAISMQRVIYYLAILLVDQDKVIAVKPIFMESLPRLEGLVKIYRGIQSVMDQSPKRSEVNGVIIS